MSVVVREFLKKPTDMTAFALTPELNIPAVILHRLMGDWVTQTLADRLPEALLQNFSPQTLRLDPSNRFACNPLMALYWAYFYTSESGANGWSEPQSTVALGKLSGVHRDKLSAWIDEGCKWLFEVLQRRESLSKMGISSSVIGKIGEYQVESLAATAETITEHAPHALWIYGKISGLGKTVYAIRLAEHLIQTRSFTRMVYVEFQRPAITSEQPFAASEIVLRLYNTLIQASETVLSTDEMLDSIRDKLSIHGTVVVLDNLETVREAESILTRLIEMNPDTGFIFVSRMTSDMNIMQQSVPELTSPARFVEARVGLNHPIAASLLTKINTLKPLYPLFLEYVVGIILKTNHFEEFLNDYAQPTAPHSALKSFMQDVFNQIWTQIDPPAQQLAMSLLLASPDGARKEWLERVSGLSGEAFDAAAVQLENTPLWTQGYLSGYWGAHAATRSLLEKNLNQRGWADWMQLRRRAVLAWLHDDLIRLDNMKEVTRHLDSIHILLEMSRENLDAAGNNAILQTVASYITILFERGAWMVARGLCQSYLIDNPLKPTSLTGLLAVQEMAVVWADIYSSINGSGASNRDRTHEILGHLDRLQDRLILQFTRTSLEPMIKPLLDVARALTAYNRGGVLPQARRYIDNALALLPESEMGDTLAFARGIAGFIYWRLGDLQAPTQFRKALAHYDETNQNLRSVWIQSNIALAYDSWLPLGEAEDMIQKALTRGRSLGHQRTLTDNTATLALIYLVKGDLDAAEATFNQQTQLIIQSIKSPTLAAAITEMWKKFDYVSHKESLNEDEFRQSIKREVARAAGNIGIVFTAQKEYEKAAKAFQLDLALGHELRPSRGHAETNINLAVCLHRMGDDDGARAALRAAENVANHPGHEPLKGIWLRAMALLPGKTTERIDLLHSALYIAWEKGRWIDITGAQIQQANLNLALRKSLRDEALALLRRVGADGWADRVRSDLKKDDLLLPLIY